MHSHEPASFVYACTRAAHFASCLLLMSMFAFDVLLAAPTARRTGGSLARWKGSFRGMIGWTLLISLLTGGGWLALAVIAMSGLPSSDALQADTLSLVWNHTHFGLVWKVRLAALAATALVGVAVVRMRDPARPRALLMWIGLMTSTALCVSLAWSGHAMIPGAGSWHIIADAFHIGVCGIWPATLVPLFFSLRPGETADRASDEAAELVRRFSNWSLTAVAVVATTGAVNAWYLVGSPVELFTTAYGRTLLLKIGMFVGMVGLGALNRVWIRRGLSWGGGNIGKLRMGVGAEILLAVGIIVAVGYLGLLPPGG